MSNEINFQKCMKVGTIQLVFTICHNTETMDFSSLLKILMIPLLLKIKVSCKCFIVIYI